MASRRMQPLVDVETAEMLVTSALLLEINQNKTLISMLQVTQQALKQLYTNIAQEATDAHVMGDSHQGETLTSNKKRTISRDEIVSAPAACLSYLTFTHGLCAHTGHRPRGRRGPLRDPIRD